MFVTLSIVQKIVDEHETVAKNRITDTAALADLEAANSNSLSTGLGGT
jgi:hypothetical protein